MSRGSAGSSSGYARPLELASAPAARLAGVAALVAGAVVVYAAPLSHGLTAALLAWLGVAAALARSREGARARWSAGQGWRLAVRGSPDWVTATPGHATRVLPALVLLWLTDTRGRRRCLVLTPASCGSEAHRRLRARLRLGAAP